MTIEELNQVGFAGEMDEFIRVCEARQIKALSHIADDICSRRGVRLVLLAGASSAGKTTTATRLCTQLRVNGLTALHFSTDDYFVGDDRNPRDAEGKLDYEHVECVDIARLAADVNRLLAGEAVHLRHFDFTRHEGYDADAATAIAPGGFIVIEGIHALNPRLTEGIAENCKYRPFVEPRPRLELFMDVRLGSADQRFLRRLVRDRQFRKIDPLSTYERWPSVLAGEKRWIEPFRSQADTLFDSGLDYELAVLKPYVLGLLALIRRKVTGDARLDTLYELLETVEAVPPVAVPGDSILRETIGSSQLEYV